MAHQTDEDRELRRISEAAEVYRELIERWINAIERMFCRLKDFRRIATRFDGLATNFLAAGCLAVIVSYRF
jgi:transposase